jgi:hypothetical protein
MGIVFGAFDRTLRRRVALRLLRPSHVPWGHVVRVAAQDLVAE